jgi:molybdenum cofactor cytidylyltransferase
MAKISAILLGAGRSRRMGEDKLSLPWGRKTVFEHCLEILLRSEAKEVIVVLSDRTGRMAGRLKRRRVELVMNPDDREGMASSIRRGIKAVHPGSDGILIALGDQPTLKTRTVNVLVRAFTEGKGEIIVPSFRGKRGHPVIFHKKYQKELMQLKGDTGGRAIIERYPDAVRVVRVRSQGVVKDIDTWQDYRRESRRGSGMME